MKLAFEIAFETVPNTNPRQEHRRRTSRKTIPFPPWAIFFPQTNQNHRYAMSSLEAAD